MKLRPQRREAPDVNLTPLIDVVFLLLIFFMVSTTFRKETELQIDLPEAEQTQAAVSEEPLELAIDAQGRYYLNQRLLPANTRTVLAAALKPYAGRREQAFTIRADGKTPHQAVVTALDVAAQLGFERLSLAAAEPAATEDR